MSEILAAAEREEKKEDAEQETTRDISVQFTVPRRDVKIQACPLAKSKGNNFYDLYMGLLAHLLSVSWN